LEEWIVFTSEGDVSHDIGKIGRGSHFHLHGQGKDMLVEFDGAEFGGEERGEGGEEGVLLGMARRVHQLTASSPAKARVTAVWRSAAISAPAKNRRIRCKKFRIESPSRTPS